ncbi:hypothetical protein B0H10DRAFT_2208079 [Mycena sp. CBHHK59/15]|nr:hypothetical protein B0H10DRAFT_2208079 [Mycena sp. CBHHK59/15]
MHVRTTSLFLASALLAAAAPLRFPARALLAQQEQEPLVLISSGCPSADGSPMPCISDEPPIRPRWRSSPPSSGAELLNSA